MSPKSTAKETEFYLRLRYPVELRELAPEEGGGYLASIPQLGAWTFTATGETREEALDALDALRRELIPELVAGGAELPEPVFEHETLERYSGNLMLRVPAELHARLARQAKQSGCSLNKLATMLLSERAERRALLDEVRAELRREIRALRDTAPQEEAPAPPGSPALEEAEPLGLPAERPGALRR